MTWDEILRSEKPVLTPADVAGVLGCHPYALNVEAEAGTLPFPAVRIGRRVKIPREGFIAWMRGERKDEAHV